MNTTTKKTNNRTNKQTNKQKILYEYVQDKYTNFFIDGDRSQPDRAIHHWTTLSKVDRTPSDDPRSHCDTSGPQLGKGTILYEPLDT